jgi:hypothetical protein
MFGGLSLNTYQKTCILVPASIATIYCIKTKKSLLVSSAIVLISAIGGLTFSSIVK